MRYRPIPLRAMSTGGAKRKIVESVNMQGTSGRSVALQPARPSGPVLAASALRKVRG